MSEYNDPDAAIRKVLESEEEVRDAIRQCREEAERTVAEARERARRIEERADDRIRRLHEAMAESGAEAAGEEPTEEGDAEAAAREQLAAAVRAVADDLLGQRDEREGEGR